MSGNSQNSTQTIYGIYGNRSPVDSINPNAINLPDTIHRVRQRMQLRIPPQYSQEPILSNLARRYEVAVNIHSALLAYQSRESGWFDLEFCGTPDRIQQALSYLSQLQVEIWSEGSSPKETPPDKHWFFDS